MQKKKTRKIYRYLDEVLPLDVDQTCVYNTKDKGHDYKKWRRERKLYGFDERETWALSFTSAVWLYSHLRRFKDLTDCEMYSDDAHQYNVNIIKVDKEARLCYTVCEEDIKYCDKIVKRKFIKFDYIKLQLSYGEIIDLILAYLKEYIATEENIDASEEKIAVCNALGAEAFKLYGIILPSLWW